MLRKKTLKVLSVDWDFFQNVDIETLFYYPDGHDLPTTLSSMIWANHYANDKENEKLQKVTVNETKLRELLDILMNQKHNTPIAIVQSHIHIYDFILSHMKDYDRCDITNIDMHHDMFNDNEELDCGNWVSHIKKTIPESNIKWIANLISLEAYGLDKLPIEYDFESIKNKKFDLIFICRSDIWSPPHLDKYFNMIVERVQMHFDSMLTQKEILKPRDIKDAVDSIREMNKQMLSEFNQRKANK